MMLEPVKKTENSPTPGRSRGPFGVGLALLFVSFFLFLPNFASADSVRDCLNSPLSETIGELSKIGSDTRSEDKGSGGDSEFVDFSSVPSLDFYFAAPFRNGTAWEIRKGLPADLATVFGSHSATSPPAQV